LFERLKLALLPSSPALAGAEVELVDEDEREARLKKALEPLGSRYDYILVDCPPSLGLLTVNGLVAAKDGALVPVQCEYLALEGLGLLTQTIQRVRQGLFPQGPGVVLTTLIQHQASSDVVARSIDIFRGRSSTTCRSIRLAGAIPWVADLPRPSSSGAPTMRSPKSSRQTGRSPAPRARRLMPSRSGLERSRCLIPGGSTAGVAVARHSSAEAPRQPRQPRQTFKETELAS
jgi:hypothetical protein